MNLIEPVSCFPVFSFWSMSKFFNVTVIVHESDTVLPASAINLCFNTSPSLVVGILIVPVTAVPAGNVTKLCSSTKVVEPLTAVKYSSFAFAVFAADLVNVLAVIIKSAV